MINDSKRGPVLRVRAKPRASADAVTGTDARGALAVSVRAAPEAGKANEAVLKVLAAHLGVARGSLELVGGASSRDKRVLVSGMDASELRARLGRLL